MSRDKLVLFGKRGVLSQITIPYELMRNLEIIDKPHFANQIREFIENNRIRKRRTVIVLDQSMVFHASEPLASSSDTEQLEQKFAQQLPFPEDRRLVLTIPRTQKLFMFGINNEVLETLTSTLESRNNKLLAAVPAAAYGLKLNSKTDATKLRKLFSHKKWVEAANFLHIHKD
ncbi:MAG: hypothetical protein U5K77_00165 [Candidatus Saccharibacteria bacterium]|nr:hypothetical protein [Candidatus Saccharibacteria bacterium]